MIPRTLCLILSLALGAVTASAQSAADKRGAQPAPVARSMGLPLDVLLPALKQGRALVPTTENPFKRVVTQRRVDKLDDSGQGIEGMVRTAVAGKYLGGIIAPSAHFRGGAILRGVLFEVDDELYMVSAGGDQVSVIPGFRVFLKGVSPAGLVFEVHQLGAGADQAVRSTVTITMDDYFRP